MSLAGVLWLLLIPLCFRVTTCTKDAPFRGECQKLGRFTSPLADFALTGHVISTLSVASAMDCALECVAHTQCSSYNCEAAAKPQLVCELNDKKAATPSELTSRPGYNYYDTQENLPDACASSPCYKSECVDSCVEGEGFRCICTEQQRYGDRCQYWKEGAANFDMVFDKATDYVQLENTRISNNFAICVWFKTQAQGWHTLFSQATHVENQGLHLRCEDMATCEFMFSGETRTYKLVNPLNDGEWHHICVEHGYSGYAMFSVDGARRGSGPHGLAKQKDIHGGAFVIGQKLTVLGAPFDQAEGFVGSMSHFNVWDHTIAVGTLKSFAQRSCRTYHGDALSWKEFLLAHPGGVTIDRPSACQTKVPESDFSFEFPACNTGDYVTGPSLPAMSHVTYCFWIQKSEPSFVVFSYATQETLDALTTEIGDKHGFNIFIRNTNFNFGMPPLSDGLWHHVCITWENGAGQLRSFLDGVRYYKENSVKKGLLIPGGGKLHFGQRQKAYGGDHNPNKCSVGQLSGFHMWSRVLVLEELVGLSLALGTEFGDVVSWKNLRPNGQGNVKTLTGTRPDNYGASLSNFQYDFTTRALANYVSLPSFDAAAGLTAFTVCLWMKSSASADMITFLSYAIPGSYNEICLWYNIKDQKIVFNVGSSTTFRKAGVEAKLTDNWWHHVCAAWTNGDGSYRIWHQGKQRTKDTGHKKGHVIGGSGVLMIGQEQDTLGGDLDLTQSFIGKITGLNIWDTHFTERVVYALSRGLSLTDGNVLPWRSLRFTYRRHGNVNYGWNPGCRLPVATVTPRRNQYCKDNHVDSSCSGPSKALFDRKKVRVGKGWGCYKSQALKTAQDSLGEEYDVSKGLLCVVSPHSTLCDIS